MASLLADISQKNASTRTLNLSQLDKIFMFVRFKIFMDSNGFCVIISGLM